MKYLNFKPFFQFKASYNFIADFALKSGCADTDMHWLGIARTWKSETGKKLIMKEDWNCHNKQLIRHFSILKSRPITNW